MYKMTNTGLEISELLILDLLLANRNSILTRSLITYKISDVSKYEYNKMKF